MSPVEEDDEEFSASAAGEGVVISFVEVVVACVCMEVLV